MGTFSTGSKVSDLHIHVHIRNINIIYIDHIDVSWGYSYFFSLAIFVS